MSMHQSFCLLVLVLCLAGCGQPASAPSIDPPTPPAAAHTTAPSDTPAATLDAAATQAAQAAQQTKDVENTAIAQLGATHDVIKATVAAMTATAPILNATRTAQMGVKYTATAGVTATAEADKAGFLALIDQLKAEGKVGSTSGEYYQIQDFARSEARMNYFFPSTLGYEAENFVFTANMAWASGGMNADWAVSGCGVLYGIQGDGKEAILTYLGLDGYTHTMMGYKNEWPEVAFNKWGKPELPLGKARMTMVLWDKRATVYVNDELSSEYFAPLYRPGDLGLTVVSGTNKDFGTMCMMTEIKLFIFD